MDHTLLVILFIVIVGPIVIGFIATLVILVVTLLISIVTWIGKLIAKEQ